MFVGVKGIKIGIHITSRYKSRISISMIGSNYNQRISICFRKVNDCFNCLIKSNLVINETGGTVGMGCPIDFTTFNLKNEAIFSFLHFIDGHHSHFSQRRNLVRNFLAIISVNGIGKTIFIEHPKNRFIHIKGQHFSSILGNLKAISAIFGIKVPFIFPRIFGKIFMTTAHHHIKFQRHIIYGNLRLSISAFAVYTKPGRRCMGNRNGCNTACHFTRCLKFLPDRHIFLSVWSYV